MITENAINCNYLDVTYFSMSPAAFESMRLLAVVVTVLLKIALMPIYLQSYLNLAEQKLEVQKKEAGRITNVDFQKKVLELNYSV